MPIAQRADIGRRFGSRRDGDQQPFDSVERLYTCRSDRGLHRCDRSRRLGSTRHPESLHSARSCGSGPRFSSERPNRLSCCLGSPPSRGSQQPDGSRRASRGQMHTPAEAAVASVSASHRQPGSHRAPSRRRPGPSSLPNPPLRWVQPCAKHQARSVHTRK